MWIDKDEKKAVWEKKKDRTLYELSEKGIQADAYISTDELADLFLYYYLEQQEEQKKQEKEIKLAIN